MKQLNNQEPLYYPVMGGSVPELTNGRTRETIIKEENTFSTIVTLKRLISKVREYLDTKGISYTQIIISPSVDLLMSEKDVKEFPTEIGEGTYNQLLRMDDIKNYCSVDLSCVCYIDGANEELIYPTEHDNFGLDLDPKIVKYDLFIKLLDKAEIVGHRLPNTYGQYKMMFIEEELKEELGYNLNTDIIAVDKKYRLG